MALNFTRAAVLVELDGEALALKLSVEQWHRVLDIASEGTPGKLSAARVPNQKIFDVINHREV